MCYRPALFGNSSQYYYLERSINEFGYKAKKVSQSEYELTDWKKESKGSSITPYALVDLTSGTMFAVKVSQVQLLLW